MTALAALFAGGCRPRVIGPVVLLEHPVRVTATEAPALGPLLYQIRVEHGGQTWLLHTLARALRDVQRPRADRVTSTLSELVHWQPPYLFIREDNGDDSAWRGNVDHVFRIEGQRAVRLGTVAASSGAPGSQLRDGYFHDIYNRLEFTFLTSHASAPRFTLVLEERDHEFRVNVDQTWSEGRPRLAERQAELRELAAHPDRLRTESDRRRARGTALFCLALTHYCDRYSEYLASVDLAQAALGPVDDLIAEVATIIPGETAPSRDEILRSSPALVNLFKESPGSDVADDPDDPVRRRWKPVLPPSVGANP